MSSRALSRSVFLTTLSRLSLIMSRSFWKFVNTKAIGNLIKENEELMEQIAGQRKQISEIQKQLVDNEIISKKALQMANNNQQYSRKFNTKIEHNTYSGTFTITMTKKAFTTPFVLPFDCYIFGTVSPENKLEILLALTQS
jgi:hypothetical protein